MPSHAFRRHNAQASARMAVSKALCLPGSPGHGLREYSERDALTASVFDVRKSLLLCTCQNSPQEEMANIPHDARIVLARTVRSAGRGKCLRRARTWDLRVRAGARSAKETCRGSDPDVHCQCRVAWNTRLRTLGGRRVSGRPATIHIFPDTRTPSNPHQLRPALQTDPDRSACVRISTYAEIAARWHKVGGYHCGVGYVRWRSLAAAPSFYDRS